MCMDVCMVTPNINQPPPPPHHATHQHTDAFSPSSSATSTEGAPPPTPHQTLRSTLQSAITALQALPPPPTTNEKSASAAAFAFDDGITRALKGNAPRRALRVPSDLEGVRGYRGMLVEVVGVVGLLELGVGAGATAAAEVRGAGGGGLGPCAFFKTLGGMTLTSGSIIPHNTDPSTSPIPHPSPYTPHTRNSPSSGSGTAWRPSPCTATQASCPAPSCTCTSWYVEKHTCVCVCSYACVSCDPPDTEGHHMNQPPPTKRRGTRINPTKTKPINRRTTTCWWGSPTHTPTPNQTKPTTQSYPTNQTKSNRPKQKDDDLLLGQPHLSLRVALAEHMAAVGVPVSLR